ncbi:hypothetical protein B0H14DRAFT_2789035 [Mycena olivaceomarginata]|nr:hypothetical protein B0H14DRAFT_2789035 [Mycena olivaceomarginata]
MILLKLLDCTLIICLFASVDSSLKSRTSTQISGYFNEWRIPSGSGCIVDKFIIALVVCSTGLWVLDGYVARSCSGCRD